MKRNFALCVVALTVGCSDAQRSSYGTEPPAGQNFILSGIVRDEDGRVLPGATVTAIDVRSWIWTATSNESGFFSFEGIAGKVALRITMPDYLEVTTDVSVQSNLSIMLWMTRVDAIEIALGVVLHSRVPGRALPCDPSGWDGRAPCRRLRFTAPKTGLLRIDITWSGAIELDAVVLSSSGKYIAYSSGHLSHIAVQSPVDQGQTYEVRVHSYYAEQEFDLKADLLPNQ